MTCMPYTVVHENHGSSHKSCISSMLFRYWKIFRTCPKFILVSRANTHRPERQAPHAKGRRQTDKPTRPYTRRTPVHQVGGTSHRDLTANTGRMARRRPSLRRQQTKECEMKPVFAIGLLMAAATAGAAPADFGHQFGPAPAETRYAPDASTVVHPGAGTSTTLSGVESTGRAGSFLLPSFVLSTSE